MTILEVKITDLGGGTCQVGCELTLSTAKTEAERKFCEGLADVVEKVSVASMTRKDVLVKPL